LKKTILALAIASLMSNTASAASEGLEETDFAWVVKTLAALVVSTNCNNGYELNAAGARLWGDQNGADVQHLSTAIMAAQASIAGQDYERSDIDPKVTRVLLKSADGFSELIKKDKVGTCKKFTDLGVRDGFLKKK
jgi:hypothetical protein